ncbi:MAG: carboxyl transferase domain-containing protein [Gammaproteobacteria bacterium]
MEHPDTSTAPPRRLLVANRGEIAVRILRTAAALGLRTVAIATADDARALHLKLADEWHVLDGRGVAPFLDIEQIVALARRTGCDAIHPGYGLLSENAAFAQRCEDAGIVFVGPRTRTLAALGDKCEARALAAGSGVPVLEASDGPVTADEARAFFAALNGGAMVLKAVHGGGGRGMRVVHEAGAIDRAHERCTSEARAAFGDGALYAERFLPDARHVEVQVAGDGTGAVLHLFERECTLQRRHQKLVEFAPAPGLPAALRARLVDAALRMAARLQYRGLGTFEFLVAAGHGTGEPDFAFIEANPRLQVEHTVTEAVLGRDLVELQLSIAAGATFADLALTQAAIGTPRGLAVQLRVNMERMQPDGSARPAGGTLAVFEPPAGPGVRVDSFGYAGYTTSPHFDSLLAKVILHEPGGDYGRLLDRAARALAEFRVQGVDTNIAFLQALLRHDDVRANRIHAGFVEAHVDALVGTPTAPALHFGAGPASARGRAGAAIDHSDPLAVLDYGRRAADAAAADAGGSPPPEQGDGLAVRAPMQGTVIAIQVEPGAAVAAGQALLVMEAMKMEHEVAAPVAGTVTRIDVGAGDAVIEGHGLLWLAPGEAAGDAAASGVEEDPDAIRPDLAEVLERHARTLDAARPEAVARRRRTGQRTARENIEDLCDPGSFVEYGPLVIANQRRRRSVPDLIATTPADGLVMGLGTVNRDRVGEDRARCVAMSYDYTVFAGTQGNANHHKKDRLFTLAERLRLPLVMFAEGGGGRPGDDGHFGDARAFHYFARLSGLVPLVGIVSGRCYAGNAALLGMCDVIIATANSNIGMGGPAMIEGGGLGVFRPEEIGPIDVQSANGVVDIAVADEAEAVRAARQYLSYFQGPVREWTCADQRRLRGAVPENRMRVYDVRRIIDLLADTGSVLELRRDFGRGMITALARIEGRPVGIVANNPMHLAGAIDSDGADKSARFLQLCDAFDIPVVFLCDTPGIMVGPEAEKTALVRHSSRALTVSANLDVPFCTVILRKAYGLGMLAMAGGSFKVPLFTVAWPTGEFGPMGLEGAVKLGYRRELEAAADPAERKALYDKLVEKQYQRGKALNIATLFDIDDVIDPAESRRWIAAALAAAPPPAPRAGKKRPYIDTW